MLPIPKRFLDPSTNHGRRANLSCILARSAAGPAPGARLFRRGRLAGPRRDERPPLAGDGAVAGHPRPEGDRNCRRRTGLEGWNFHDHHHRRGSGLPPARRGIGFDFRLRIGAPGGKNPLDGARRQPARHPVVRTISIRVLLQGAQLLSRRTVGAGDGKGSDRREIKNIACTYAMGWVKKFPSCRRWRII